MYTFRPVHSDAEWNLLLQALPGATVFHTLEWLRGIEAARGHRLRTLVIQRADEPVGLFPMFFFRRRLVKVCSSSFRADSPYLGPLVDPALLGEMLDDFARWIRHQGVGYSAITFPRQIAPEVSTGRRFSRAQSDTYLADVTGSHDAVFARCQKRCREVIRKSRRRGVEIVESDLRPFIDRHAEMALGVLARQGLPPLFSRDELRSILDSLHAGGRVHCVRAMLGEQMIGGSFFAHFGDTAYAIHTATDYDYVEYGAATLLMWEGMSWANRNGFRTLDFTGAGRPSLSFWKESFGARRTPITRLKWVSPGLSASMWVLRRGVAPLLRAVALAPAWLREAAAAV
ncbi:MAG: hypothetical protein BIFFINMI_01307 [Phycisphaerae bacterium]|nr:hypothetical protein [Phycisphaerae bacterium]